MKIFLLLFAIFSILIAIFWVQYLMPLVQKFIDVPLDASDVLVNDIYSYLPYLMFLPIFVPLIIFTVFIFYFLKRRFKTQRINNNPRYDIAKIVDMKYSPWRINNKRLIHIFVDINWEKIQLKNQSPSYIFYLSVWDSVYVKYEMWNPENISLIDKWEYEKNV